MRIGGQAIAQGLLAALLVAGLCLSACASRPKAAATPVAVGGSEGYVGGSWEQWLTNEKNRASLIEVFGGEAVMFAQVDLSGGDASQRAATAKFDQGGLVTMSVIPEEIKIGAGEGVVWTASETDEAVPGTTVYVDGTGSQKAVMVNSFELWEDEQPRPYFPTNAALVNYRDGESGEWEMGVIVIDGNGNIAQVVRMDLQLIAEGEKVVVDEQGVLTIVDALGKPVWYYDPEVPEWYGNLGPNPEITSPPPSPTLISPTETPVPTATVAPPTETPAPTDTPPPTATVAPTAELSREEQIKNYVEKKLRMNGFSPEERRELQDLIIEYFPKIVPPTREEMLLEFPYIDPEDLDRYEEVVDPVVALRRIGEIINNEGGGFWFGKKPGLGDRLTNIKYDETFSSRNYGLSGEAEKVVNMFLTWKEMIGTLSRDYEDPGIYEEAEGKKMTGCHLLLWD